MIRGDGDDHTRIFRTPAEHRPQDLDRRLDQPPLRDVLTRWGRVARDTYVCGSNAFVEAVTTSLVLETGSPGSIRTERYGGKD